MAKFICNLFAIYLQFICNLFATYLCIKKINLIFAKISFINPINIMKKSIFAAITAILGIIAFNSCQNEEPLSEPQLLQQTASIKKNNGRSIAEAAEIARQSISLIKDGQSRAGGRYFDATNVKIGVSTNSRGSNDTLMYVFNFDDNQGFSIVAYDKKIDGLIAVTEQGYYDPSEPSDNPGFELYMEMAREMLSNAGENNGINKLPDSLFIGDQGEPVDSGINKDLVQYKFEEKLVKHTEIIPNYDIKWGQTNPEGLLFSNAKSGCTNTAMLMVMSYFRQPESIQINYEDSIKELLIVDWDILMKHKLSVNYTSTLFDYCHYFSQDKPHTLISKLCRQFAYLNNSTFSNSSTDTRRGNNIQTFKNFGYSVGKYVNYDETLVTNSLLDHAIITVGGTNIDSNTTGHAWIIDGYDYQEIWSGEYIKRWGEDWELVNDHGIRKSKFFHMNWGWCGAHNGYFVTSVFDANKKAWYDNNNTQSSTCSEQHSYKDIQVLVVKYN